MSCALSLNGLCMATIDFFPRKKTWSCTRQGIPLRPPSPKKRIIFTGALAYIHIFVVMFEMYMLCVSSDISHHILYVVLYHVGLFSLIGI